MEQRQPKSIYEEYDFNNGDALDTVLFLVELTIKQDSSFVSNYNNGSFSLPSASFINTDLGVISAVSWAGTSFAVLPMGTRVSTTITVPVPVLLKIRCLSITAGTIIFPNSPYPNGSMSADFLAHRVTVCPATIQ